MHDPLLKKIRVLSQMTIFSVALNVGFFVALTYIVAERKWVSYKALEDPVISSMTSGAVIRTFFSYSYQDLLRELSNKELVEYGYTRRDLALSCLAQFYYFDLEKALANTELQRREMEFIHGDGGEIVKLTIYAGLNDSHFASVIAFSQREEWPLTPEGLFYELKKSDGAGSCSSLQEAFFTTHEFYTLYTLFARSFQGVSQEEVLSVLLEGNWNSIADFVSKVRSVKDLSIDQLRRFLLDFVPTSLSAINLWIHYDSEHLLKKLDDRVLMSFIEHIRENDLQTTLFLKGLICSVRGDAIRKIAGSKLYEFSNETPPQPYDHEVCIRRFVPSFFSQTTPNVEPKGPFGKIALRKHTVQEGDSLWKIARLYHVDLHALIEENKLDPDSCLSVGVELIIPQG